MSVLVQHTTAPTQVQNTGTADEYKYKWTSLGLMFNEEFLFEIWYGNPNKKASDQTRLVYNSLSH